MGWCWVNFQCRGVLLIWIRVGQGPTGLAVGAGGGCLDIFSLVYHFSFLSPSLWETARYRLKYCLKGPLSPKQPTNQPNLAFVQLDTLIFRLNGILEIFKQLMIIRLGLSSDFISSDFTSVKSQGLDIQDHYGSPLQESCKAGTLKIPIYFLASP